MSSIAAGRGAFADWVWGGDQHDGHQDHVRQ